MPGEKSDVQVTLGLDTSYISNINNDLTSYFKGLGPYEIPIKVDTKSLDELSKKLKEITAQVNKAGSSSGGGNSSGRNLTAQLERYQKKYAQLGTTIDTLRAKMSEFQKESDFGSRLQKSLSTIESLRLQLNSGDISDTTAQAKAYQTIEKNIASINAELSRYRALSAESKRDSKLDVELSKYQKKYAQLGTTIDTLTSKMARFQGMDGFEENLGSKLSQITSLQTSLDSGATDDVQGQINQYKELDRVMDDLRKTIGKYSAELNNANREAGQNNKQLNNTRQISQAYQDLYKFYQQYQTAISRSPDLDSKFQKALQDLTDGTIDGGANATKTVTQLKEEAIRAGSAVETLGDRMRQTFSDHIYTAVTSTAVMALEQGLQEVYDNVVAIDGAVTQLRIVSGASDNQMSTFLGSATDSAKELGANVVDLLGSLEEFTRLGYNLEDSLNLSGAATILSNTANTTVEEMTTGLTSIIKGFQMDASEAMHIADVLLEVDKKYAVSASELTEALQRGGAALAAGNNTFEESVALVAAGNASVQNAMRVGTALKTTSMRLRGAEADLEAAGEATDEFTKSTSTMRNEILALSGVDIMLNDSTFKSTYQILSEIAAVQDQLSDIDQAALLEAIAGKENAATIQSVITNLNDLTGAYETAMTAEGAAQAANDQYVQSIGGRLETLSATFAEFSNSLLDSDLIKGAVSGATSVLEVLTSIVDTVGGLPAAATAASAALSFADMGFFRREGGNITNPVAKIIESINKYNAELDIAKRSSSDFINVVAGGNGKLSQYLQGLNGASASVLQYGTSLIGATAQTVALQVATTALNAAITFGISVAISFAVSAISSWINRTQNLIEAGEAAKEEIDTLSSTFESNQSTIDSLSESYATLAQHIDQLSGRNISLSAEGYEEFAGYAKQIAEIYPDLVKYWNGEIPVLVISGDAEEIQQQLEDRVEQDRRETNLEIADNLPDVYDGIRANDAIIDSLNAMRVIAQNDPRGYAVAAPVLAVAGGVSDYLNGDYSIESIENAIAEIQATTSAAWQDYQESLRGWLFTNDIFTSQSDQLQAAIQQMVYNIDWRSLGISTGEGAQTFLSNLMNQLVDPSMTNGIDMGSYFEQLFTLNFDSLPQSTLKAAAYKIRNNLVSAFGEGEETDALIDSVYSSLGLTDAEALDDRIDAIVQNVSDAFSGADTEGLNEFLNSLSNYGLEEFLKYWESGDFDSYEDLISGFKEMAESMEEASDASDTLADKFQTLWDSEDFSDAKQELEELAETTGITASDITILADDNAELSALLNETGMSAQFVAQAFQRMCESGDGFGFLSDEIVSLGNALLELDPYLQNADDSYQNYQDSLNRGDYDDQYDRYVEAYDALGEMIDNDEYGKDFYRTIEYLFGEGHGADSIDDLISKYKELESILGEDTNGLGFLEKLYQSQDTLGKEWVTLEDGAYLWDIAPEDFAEIADYFGVTEDMVASLVSSLGMWGEYASYDIEKVVDEVKNLNAAFTDVEGNTLMSKQALRDILSTNYGFESFEVDQIMANLEDAEGLQLLDFSVEGQDEIESLLNTLGESSGLELFNDGVLDANQLVALLANEFGMSNDAIQSFIENIKEAGTAVEGSLGADIEPALNSFEELRAGAQSSIETLQEFYRDSDLGDVFSNIDLDSSNIDTINEEIGAVLAVLEQYRNEDGTFDLAIPDGSKDVMSVLQALIAKKQELQAPAVMSVDTSQVDGDLGAALSLMQKFQTAYNNLEYTKTIGVNTDQAQQDLDNVLAEMQLVNNTQVLANIGVDTSSVESAQSSIAALDTTAMIELGVDPSAIDSYDAPDADATCIIGVDSSLVDAWLATNHDSESTHTFRPNLSSYYAARGILQRTTHSNHIIHVIERGSSSTQGTAHYRGTAYAGGNWGASSSGMALMGELGPELIVRKGRWFTVGDESAEFVPYQKGDIIFNAEQTRQILENGKITNGAKRGVAYAEGTAFASGRVVVRNSDTGKKYSSTQSNTKTTKKSSSSKKSSSKSDADETAETFDWIEILLDRIERKISELDTVAGSAYNTFTTRNNTLKKELSEVSNEITAQTGAYQAYLNAANNVGLSSTYKKQMQDGSLDISTITDENLIDKIKEYQEWYEKALDCKEAIGELTVTLGELHQEMFDNKATHYDFLIDRIQSQAEQLNGYIELASARGQAIASEYYNALIKTENSTIIQLQKEQKILISLLNEAIDSGSVKVYSEAWHEMQSEINEVTQAIVESQATVAEYQATLRELSWEKFDYGQEQIGNLITETEFLLGLLEDEDMFDDHGKMSNTGLATLGLYLQEMETYQKQVEDYAKEIDSVQQLITKDSSNIDLRDRLQELVEAQQDAIASAQNQKQAILDLIKEGYDAELDSLQDLIDRYEETMESARDLYEYQKDIEEQTKTIAQLEKQLSSLSGDTSEENRKTIQELKVSLEEARSDLAETQYEQYISDQEEMLSDLYDSYEELLNSRLDNVDGLIMESQQLIAQQSDNIAVTIMNAAEDAGYSLSSSMESLWGDGSTIVSVLQAIKTSVETLYSSGSTNAQKNVSNITASDSSSSTTATGTGKTPASTNPTVTISSSTSATSSSSSNSKDKVSTISRTLQKGSTGENVKTLQRALNALGFKGKNGKVLKIDGDFQEQTKYAVQSFQKSTKWGGKISADGVVGSITKNKFKNAGYQTGVKDLPANEIAWTNEAGSEMIIRPTDDALLTTLKAGDSVLNARATENIWKMANSPQDFIMQNLGVLDRAVASGQINNDIHITFDLPNVSNYTEFMNALRKDSKFEALIKSMTVDQLAGSGRLTKNRNRW